MVGVACFITVDTNQSSPTMYVDARNVARTVCGNSEVINVGLVCIRVQV